MGGFHVPCYVILNNFIFTPLAHWKPNGDASLVDERTVYPVTYTIDYIGSIRARTEYCTSRASGRDMCRRSSSASDGSLWSTNNSISGL